MNHHDSSRRLRQCLVRLSLALALVFFPAAPAHAAPDGTNPAPEPAGGASAPDPAVAGEPAPPSPWKQGPTKIDLGHELDLELSQRYAFLPKEFAAKALEASGNFTDDSLLGIVATADHGTDWFVVLEFADEGYVKDDEEIDAEELLEGMREGNEEANEVRKQRGFPALKLEGWSDPPHYDKSKHQLIWALIVADDTGKSVNYNTRILGRRGYVSLNLVTDPAKLAGYKSEATTLLASTQFRQGARYADFDASKDKVAEYGLAGLIAAGAGLGAAKFVKLGLLAKFWNVILVALMAGKKFIVLGLIALGALLKKYYAGKKGETAG
jgi:uncharacterized membrane-anchored protein